MAGVIGATMLICGFLIRTSAKMAGYQKLFTNILALILVGSSLWVAVFPEVLPSITRQPIPSSKEAGWIELDQKNIVQLVSAGKTVFVDITADWCLTCKINKKLVLDRSEIVNRLRAPNVVRMRGDWTKRDSEIQAYLIGFNRFGIPFNAIYSSNVPDGILLPELLTKKSVLSALELANGANQIP